MQFTVEQHQFKLLFDMQFNLRFITIKLFIISFKRITVRTIFVYSLACRCHRFMVFVAVENCISFIIFVR